MNSLPPSPNPKGSHTLTKPLARRVKRAVRRLEHQLVRPADQRAPRVPANPWLTMQPAVMLTTLGPGSITSPAATGQCQIYRDNDNDTGFGLHAVDTGAVSSTIGQVFAAGSQVSVIWRNGIWWVALATGASPVYWTRSPTGGIPAAGGSWTGGASTGQAGLSPSTFSAGVYLDQGGTLNLVATGCTVRWFYKDSDPGSRLIPCVPNGDGTFDAIGDSCSAV